VRRCAGILWIVCVCMLGSARGEDRIAQAEFAARRARLSALLDSSSAAVFRSSDALTRNSDVSYPYRQESNLLYLTGANQMNVGLIVAPGGVMIGDTVAHVVLFAQRDGGMTARIDDGIMLDWSRFGEVLTSLCSRVETLYAATFSTPFVQDWLNARPLFIERESRRELEHRFPNLKVKNAGPLVARLRVYKTPAEVDIIRRAIAVTGDGLRHALSVCVPGAKEYEMQAALEGELLRQGASGPAFPSIIGSGANSLILHYDANRRTMRAGEVVVVDVGAEIDGYAADVTRTVSVGGKFTREQREIYAAVRQAQRDVLARIKPGLAWSELDATGKASIAARGFGKYWRHGISHHLGLDVHDAGIMDTLRAGMVITLEPGVYVPVEDTVLAAGYRGVGVRLEDDILVTESGCQVLSESIPVEAGEIEMLIKPQKKKASSSR
jgi:Xaa-Pro aminopeptidase